MGNIPSYFQYSLRKLIPKYDIFVQQSQSRNGDHSSCANNFLTKIVPYLVQTILQNGVYFISDYPHHYFTRISKVKNTCYNLCDENNDST